jgi:hypothetical protein
LLISFIDELDDKEDFNLEDYLKFRAELGEEVPRE